MAEKLGAAEKSLSKFIPFLPFLFSLSPGEILPGNYYPKPNNQPRGRIEHGRYNGAWQHAPTMKTRPGFPFCRIEEKLKLLKAHSTLQSRLATEDFKLISSCRYY